MQTKPKKLPAPLSLDETLPGYSVRRKAALAASLEHGASCLCIARGCCSSQWGESVFCLAHGMGLGLYPDIKPRQ